jgi:predicted DNA-binding transcriptional regulator AlpA
MRPTPAKFRSSTYTVGDIAAHLQMSTRQVWRLRDAERLPPSINVGRLVRWNASVIDRWIAAGCPPVPRAGRA